MLFVLLIIGVVMFAGIVLFAASTVEKREIPGASMKITLPEDISTKKRVMSERLKSRAQGAA
ncbi:MAG: hypothetical protein NVS9B15_15500 [Acidobacteriaceae bacterium]